MSTYMDLPLIASLVVLWFYHSYLLNWTYNSDAMAKRLQIQLSWDLGVFENSGLFELSRYEW